MKIVCPLCSGKVKIKKRYIKCTKCKKKWRFIENIPSFVSVKFSSSFGLLSDLIEMKIIEKIEKEGFESAINFIRRKYPNILERIFNRFIRSYLYLGDLKSRKRCLEIGSGYGALTIELSKIYKEVISMDISFQRVKFIKHRLTHLKIKNVKLIHCDAFNLPFPKDYFDCIYLVGVLEWIPLSYEGNPREVQINFLKYLKEKIKKGGKVIVGIENRFGIQYFLGWKDHNGLWGTNLLPRWLANIYSQLALKSEYRTYTYSFNGYRKLFLDAGFKNVEIYAPLRSYRFPRFMIKCNKDSFNFFFKKVIIPSDLKEKIAIKLFSLLPFFIQKLIVPHYVIRCTK